MIINYKFLSLFFGILLLIMIFLKIRSYFKFIPIHPVDFEKDINFLLYIISYKCNHVKEMVIQPRSKSNKSLLTDKIFNELLEELSIDVYDMLSEHQKAVLYKYFNEDSLMEFIVEQIFFELITEINDINVGKLLTMNNILNINNIGDQNDKNREEV